MEHQLSMFTTNKKSLVVKSNSLMEAKFHFKLWEMRLFEKMISLIKKGDTEFRACKIYIIDLINYFEGNSRNDYELIREAALSLGDKKLFIPYQTAKGAKRWAKISIFPTVTIPDGEDRGGENAYIELEFHNDLKPHLLDLKERFKAYDIRNIQSLRSIYSIRMFILLKQFDNIGFRRIEIAVLRNLLGVEEQQYKLYADFKKRVILRPQKDLKKYCDICFDFKEEKVGRKVHSITFIIKSNKPVRSKKQLEAPVEPKILSQPQQETYELVKEWGITEETLLEILKERNLEHIHTCIEVTRDTKSAKNKGAYFMSLVKKDEVVNSKKATKKTKGTQKVKAQKQEQLKKQLEEKLSKLKREKYEKEAIIVKELLEDKELFALVEEQVGQAQFVYADSSLSFADNYTKKPLFRSFVDKYVKEHRLNYFEGLDAEFLKKEKVLREKYHVLAKKG
jgi:plasmid replication initiation protein